MLVFFIIIAPVSGWGTPHFKGASALFLFVYIIYKTVVYFPGKNMQVSKMKSKVVVLYCDTYDEDILCEKIQKGFELLGGTEKFFDKDEKILMKLNLVRGAAPERAVTTHPSVVSALARVLYDSGYEKLSAGDSSGFGSPVRIMEDLGLKETFEKYNVRMADFKAGEKVAYPEGIHAKEFIISKDVIDTDALISVCKMKTHALEYITGAVKNQYGCVQGLNKAKGHTVYPSQESFARMLVDLNLCVKPRFYIMDGITAMEGNGPTSGDPTPMNVILMGADPVAVDSVFCSLIGLLPENVPTNVYGKQMGLGTYVEDEIEILTEDGEVSFFEAAERYGNPKFNVIRTKHTSRGIMGFVTRLNRFKRRPKINGALCKKCGVCVEVCPVDGKAISFKNGRNEPPVYNYKKCIRCFCCQEMCPHKAIYVKGKN